MSKFDQETAEIWTFLKFLGVPNSVVDFHNFHTGGIGVTPVHSIFRELYVAAAADCANTNHR